MKKSCQVTLGLVASMAAALLAGCGKAGPGSGPGSTSRAGNGATSGTLARRTGYVAPVTHWWSSRPISPGSSGIVGGGAGHSSESGGAGHSSISRGGFGGSARSSAAS